MLTVIFAINIATGAIATGIWVLDQGSDRAAAADPREGDPPRSTWRMPPAALLEPAPRSTGRRIITGSLAVTMVVTSRACCSS